MGTLYAVAGGKGGVGKTTTSLNLAGALQAAGHETAVVDADLGMTNLGALAGIDVETSVHDVLAGEATVGEALVTGPGEVSVLPGRRDLDAYRAADPSQLRDVFASLRRDFDAVVADTGAGLSHESLVPYGLADGTVLVTTPDDVAVGDARKTGEMVREVDGTVLGTLVTRVRESTDPTAVAERVGEPLLESVPDAGDVAGEEPMVVHAPDSGPAAAYRRLASGLATHMDVSESNASTVSSPTPGGHADD